MEDRKAGGESPPPGPPALIRATGGSPAGSRGRALGLLLLCCAGTTDQPIWRATHNLLLAGTRAGDRVVVVGNLGQVLLSDDNGRTWRLAKSPTDALLTSVLFVTPTEGWAVGQDETVLHSTDGGQTWMQLHTAAASDQALFSITAIGPGHLFTTGAYNLALETTNDGAAWQDAKLPDLDDDYHLNCVVAHGDDLFVTGESGHAFIRRAGKWIKRPLPYEGSQFACLVGADGDYYSFGLRGSAFRAAPGAAAWTKLDPGGALSTFGAANLANGHIALVGANGMVKLLDPASGQFSGLPSGTGSTLSGVVETHDGKLVVMGDDGVHLLDPAMAVKQAENTRAIKNVGATKTEGLP